ncbi:MAG: hypothetical protein ACK4N5_23230, partial [Myxococcales bacterium]
LQLGFNEAPSSRKLAPWVADRLKVQGYRVAPPFFGAIPEPSASKAILLLNLREVGEACRVGLEGSSISPENEVRLFFVWGAEEPQPSCEPQLREALMEFIVAWPPPNPPKHR